MPIGAAAWVALGSAAIVAGGSYASAKKSSKGAKEAAAIAAGATREGIDAQREGVAWQKEIYEDYKPFLMSGLEGYQKLLTDPSSYKKSPGYQFRLEEGLKSIGIADGQVNQRNLSGSQLKAIQAYSQDYATSDYDRALQRQASMAGISSQVAGASGQLGRGVAQGYENIGGTLQRGGIAQGQYAQDAANARAAGILGVSSAVGQGLSNYGMYQQYQNQTNSPYVGSQSSGDAYQPAQRYYEG